MKHIENTVKTSPAHGWIFVSDQLNTHKSESLVRFVAQQCGLTCDLGIKGKSGILKNMDSRMSFLAAKDH